MLREKDILREKDATSPAKRIYFIVQLMYLDPENLATHHKIYWELIRPFIEAVPSSLPLVDEISEHIRCDRYYKALKLTRKLVDYEQSLFTKLGQETGI